MAPVHRLVGLALHHQGLRARRGARSMRGTQRVSAPTGGRQGARLQRIVLAEEVEELRIAGVLREAPRDRIDERTQQAVAELRPAPGARTHQRRQENRLAQLGTFAAVQQVVQQDRPAGALSAEVPGRRQVEFGSLAQQALEHRLVFGEVADAGPLAFGQAMPRQVAGEHRSPCPAPSRPRADTVPCGRNSHASATGCRALPAAAKPAPPGGAHRPPCCRAALAGADGGAGPGRSRPGRRDGGVRLGRGQGSQVLAQVIGVEGF